MFDFWQGVSPQLNEVQLPYYSHSISMKQGPSFHSISFLCCSLLLALLAQVGHSGGIDAHKQAQPSFKATWKEGL